MNYGGPHLFEYNPAKVHVTVAGPGGIIPRISGYAPGSAIRVAPAAQSWFRIDGIRGQVARARQRLLAGTISIVLEERAHDNAALQLIAAADRTADLGIVSVIVFDEHGLDLAVAPFAWLLGRPEWIKGATAGTKTWVFDCERIEMINAGGLPVR